MTPDTVDQAIERELAACVRAENRRADQRARAASTRRSATLRRDDRLGYSVVDANGTTLHGPTWSLAGISRWAHDAGVHVDASADRGRGR